MRKFFLPSLPAKSAAPPDDPPPEPPVPVVPVVVDVVVATELAPPAPLDVDPAPLDVASFEPPVAAGGFVSPEHADPAPQRASAPIASDKIRVAGPPFFMSSSG